jgi:hypothetical protein
MIRSDQVEGGHRGLEILAGRNRRHIRHDAGEWRLDDGVAELARRLVALSQGIKVARVLLDRAVRIAVEVGGDRGELLMERGKLLLGVLQVRRAAS